MTTRLYNYAFGPYPQRLNIYLAEKNPPAVERIMFSQPDGHSSAPPASVKALTATGSLPILQEDDGTVIGQSLAILEYLEDRIAAPAMRGDSPASRAKVRQLVQSFDESLTFFGLWARHGSRLGHGIVRTSQEVSEICAARYFGNLRVIEKTLPEAEFLAGDNISIADCVAFAMLQYARDFYAVPVPPDCPRLETWFNRFSARPSARMPVYPEKQRQMALGLMEQTRTGF